MRKQGKADLAFMSSISWSSDATFIHTR